MSVLAASSNTSKLIHAVNVVCIFYISSRIAQSKHAVDSHASISPVSTIQAWLSGTKQEGQALRLTQCSVNPMTMSTLTRRQNVSLHKSPYQSKVAGVSCRSNCMQTDDFTVKWLPNTFKQSEVLLKTSARSSQIFFQKSLLNKPSQMRGQKDECSTCCTHFAYSHINTASSDKKGSMSHCQHDNQEHWGKMHQKPHNKTNIFNPCY